MWPPEHLAFAYLLASAATHLVRNRPPRDGEALAVLLGSQFPDLVDKPLAWGLHVLPSGRSLAHSLFVAVPTWAVLVGVVARRDARRVGVAAAFALAYASHLAGDVIYPLVVDRELRYSFLLWPLGTDASHSHDAVALVPHVRALAVEFLGFLASPRGLVYLGLDVLFFALVALLWAVDGAPGLPDRWRDDG